MRAISIWVTLLVTIALLLFFQSRDSQVIYRQRYDSPELLAPSDDDLNGRYARGPSETVSSAKRHLLSYNEKNFTLDGRPIRIVSGSVHYFRMVPSSWRPVLLYAKAMGLNAISTYVPWNMHEPSRGYFRFSGILDLRAFLEVVQEVGGLMVLLRPGPYICSEWENGGLPPFLLADEGMELRSSYEPYLDAVGHYLDVVAHQIEPYLGRPITAIQIENEYGIYGSDKDYLDYLMETWEENNVNRQRVMLFTSENGDAETVLNGSQFDSRKVLKTANLKTGAGERIEMLREIQPKAPAMISEFWTGWFDHWGKGHHVRDGGEIVEEVGAVLNEHDASVNMYMFFGGTNFGFMNGANIDRTGKYWSVVTSYDYDGMLNEFGGVRKEKYLPMQKELRAFWKGMGEEDMVIATYGDVPKSPSISRYDGEVVLDESIGLFDVVDMIADRSEMSTLPMSMEEAGGDYGMILYRHNFTEIAEARPKTSILRVSGVRDYGHVVVDGRVVGMVERNDEHAGGAPKEINISDNAKQLEIIVENRGRVTVGPFIDDRKGIIGSIVRDGKVLEGFECLTMSFVEDHVLLRDNFGRKTISLIRKTMSKETKGHERIGDESAIPHFFRGELVIGSGYARYGRELPGTHCRIGGGQGVLWVNGFNLGRFDSGIGGPQKTVFVPGEVLKEGVNDFLVLHMRMDLVEETRIELVDATDIGGR